MTHPMLEKVARAMVAVDGLDPDERIVGGQASGFEDFGPLWQAEERSEGQLGLTNYLRLARAAVQALLEPDEGMVEAGKHVPCEAEAPGGVVYSTGGEATAIYRAMLLPLIEGEGE